MFVEVLFWLGEIVCRYRFEHNWTNERNEVIGPMKLRTDSGYSADESVC